MGESHRWDVRACFSELLDGFPKVELALVDIPIGLWDAGDPRAAPARSCDAAARRLLGWPRSSSVFNPPVRPALEVASYAEACEVNARLTGKKLTIQGWNLVPKIRQVDRFLQSRSAPEPAIREAHPEVVFQGLAGGSPLRHRKKSTEGRDERLEILELHEPRAREIYQDVLHRSLRKHVARDDALDALALAVAARLGSERGLKTLPDEPLRDRLGLPMEIVYASSQVL